ncbi:MAG: aldehyde ferredoxin oxidoreductase family protein [Candidatus Geothermarchaeales archaeon]
MFGWMGTILRCDLTKGKVVKQPYPKELRHMFIGGRGVNSKILYDEIPPGIDAFSPENRLVIGTGPLVGTLAPSSSRLNVSAKSPITGGLGDGSAGGHFSPELKFAGYDHIVIHGRSEKPVYLWIDDDEVELRDASHLWGETTWDSIETIREEHGDPEIQTLLIGPAGENMVRYAIFISGWGRAPGRTGTGAVAGSKNFKGVAVRGTKPVQIARPDEFIEAVEQAYEKLKADRFYNVIRSFGTTFLIRATNEVGRLATRNSKEGWFEKADLVSGEVFNENYVVKLRSCFGCILQCGRYHKIEGKYATRGEGMEYEDISSFTSRVGCDNLEAAVYATDLCEQYGLDTLSTGWSIAYAMEAYERGLLTEEDTDGYDLSWGNIDAVIAMVEKIARREGIGDFIAEGVYRMKDRFEGGDEFAIHIKGLEPNSGDYRGVKGMGFAACSSTRGADHLRGATIIEYTGVSPERAEELFGCRDIGGPREYKHDCKTSAVKFNEDFCAFIDSVELCKFTTVWWIMGYLGPKDYSTLFSTATGVDLSPQEVMETGERIYNLERAFIVREGFSRKDDYPPPRWQNEPQPTGPAKGHRLDKENVDKMLDIYYRKRGWDKRGIPTKEKLEALGLGEIWEDIKKFSRHSREVEA